jgi:hypothetical protein
MDTVEKAAQTQLNNIEKKTGKSLNELAQLVRDSGLNKHGEIRQLLITTLGLGYGDANALARYALQAGSEQAGSSQVVKEASGGDAVLDEIYNGPKAGLRPIHEKLLSALQEFGDFEISPKKGYVSLRRKKQFAMVGPATKTRVEVGLNVKDLPAAERIQVQPAGGMCNYKVNLTALNQVDDELLGWLRLAYESAG